MVAFDTDRRTLEESIGFPSGSFKFPRGDFNLRGHYRTRF